MSTLLTKINIEKIVRIAAPHLISNPNIAFNPRPAPAILPILNASPPNAISMEIKVPRPGITLLDTSCPRSPVTTSTRQILICAPISIIMEINIANAKLA